MDTNLDINMYLIVEGKQVTGIGFQAKNTSSIANITSFNCTEIFIINPYTQPQNFTMKRMKRINILAYLIKCRQKPLWNKALKVSYYLKPLIFCSISMKGNIFSAVSISFSSITLFVMKIKNITKCNQQLSEFIRINKQQ